jgi:hypothetical protein
MLFSSSCVIQHEDGCTLRSQSANIYAPMAACAEIVEQAAPNGDLTVSGKSRPLVYAQTPRACIFSFLASHHL